MRASLLLAGVLATAVLGAGVLAGAVAGLAVPGGAPAGTQTPAEPTGTLAADGAASGRALAAIPPTWLELYRQAAATCPGLPWT
ncbi:MAG TPA: hypothetical protein VG476_16970, partial [Acidimicrobiales bacterium]|nr:hypothetical protein [Acidimicrobiales bacterium]